MWKKENDKAKEKIPYQIYAAKSAACGSDRYCTASLRSCSLDTRDDCLGVASGAVELGVYCDIAVQYGDWCLRARNGIDLVKRVQQKKDNGKLTRSIADTFAPACISSWTIKIFRVRTARSNAVSPSYKRKNFQ